LDRRNAKAEAFAAPRHILVEYSERLLGSRVLDEGQGINRVGIAVAKHRAGLLSYCGEFVEGAKASGLTARFIAEAGLRGFTVASY
jgi:polar amino acid transport system substrate-binding protein